MWEIHKFGSVRGIKQSGKVVKMSTRQHRSVHNSFMLLPIPNPSAEQAQVPVFSVSGTKPAARPDLLLSSESSLGRANAKIHQSGQHRLNLNSSSPLENGGLPWSGVYSLPRASLRDWWKIGRASCMEECRSR